MKRLTDWPERLLEVIAHHRKLPMEYGVSDCFIFPMDCVKAMTGEDPWEEVRGSYQDRLGAAKELRSRGFASVADAFAAVFPEIAPAEAKRGDLAAVIQGETIGGAVFNGTHVIGKATFGISYIVRTATMRAFRVG